MIGQMRFGVSKRNWGLPDSSEGERKYNSMWGPDYIVYLAGEPIEKDLDTLIEAMVTLRTTELLNDEFLGEACGLLV
ncbi:MAG: hypothetical protein LBH43_12410 [Treponema sp.]|jgi:hypothetical protein|nr:hypothetical protein [Treponema sp.]